VTTVSAVSDPARFSAGSRVAVKVSFADGITDGSYLAVVRHFAWQTAATPARADACRVGFI
jgi:hypothetical protein